jgi:glycosyltransferase involved in cell wall biosynthesis
MICPELPYPPTGSANKVDIWGRVLFFISNGWRIVLVICSYVENLPSQDKPAASLPRELNIDVCYTPRNPRWSQHENQQSIQKVQELIDIYQPLIIWCEYADFAALTSSVNTRGAKVWFYSHNFELAHAFEKEMKHKPWRSREKNRFIKKSVLLTRSLFNTLRKIYSVERRMHIIADHVFYISYTDMKVMSCIYRGRAKRSWVLPFLERNEIAVKKKKTLLDVVYMGSDFSNNVNMSGALALLNEVIPAVETAMPDAYRFNLIGKGCKELLNHYASKNTIIHGYVEDLQDFLRDMDIACIPITIGWGCKVKMVEALASGLPVVGAPQVFRGIRPVENAYFVCREASDYVSAFKLLRNANERQRVSLSGLEAYRTWLADCRHLLFNALEEVIKTE